MYIIVILLNLGFDSIMKYEDIYWLFSAVKTSPRKQTNRHLKVVLE